NGAGQGVRSVINLRSQLLSPPHALSLRVYKFCEGGLLAYRRQMNFASASLRAGPPLKPRSIIETKRRLASNPLNTIGYVPTLKSLREAPMRLFETLTRALRVGSPPRKS